MSMENGFMSKNNSNEQPAKNFFVLIGIAIICTLVLKRDSAAPQSWYILKSKKGASIDQMY